MKSAAFNYVRAASVEQAIGALSSAGDAYSKLLGGGQSLGPMLNLRLVQPEHLIDLSKLPALRQWSVQDETLRIGAGVRHAEVEDGKLEDVTRGLLPHVAGGIAYRAVRNRGTIGGSLAHADPAADWVATMRLLDAGLRLQGPDGERVLAAREFFLGAFTTAMHEHEVLVGIDVPVFSGSARWAYQKLCRKPGEFAEALAAIWVDPPKGVYRMVVGALSGVPLLIEGESALEALRSDAGRLAALDKAGVSDPVQRQQQATIMRRALTALDCFGKDKGLTS